jgi:hypothetical protein
MGVCTLASLIPPISNTINSEIIPVPIINFICTKRDTGLTPLVVGLGLFTGIWTGSARIGVSIRQFQKISEDLKESLNVITSQISVIQDQWWSYKTGSD